MRRTNNLEGRHLDMYVTGDQSNLSNDTSGWTASHDLRRTILGQSDVSSAYLDKLDKERDREDEVLSKSLRNIPVHIRRMVNPDPNESLTIRRWVALPRSTEFPTKRKLQSQVNRPRHFDSSPISGALGHSSEGIYGHDKGHFHKESIRRTNGRSVSLGSSLWDTNEVRKCDCAKNSPINSYGGSIRKDNLGPFQEHSQDLIHDCGTNPLANSLRSIYDSDEMFGINQVPFKCPAISPSRKKNWCVPSRLDSQIALRKAMRSHIEKQRSSAISSHVQFVNCNSLYGRHVGPPSRPCRTKLVTGGQGTDKQLTDQSIELLAILSVQEHNVPMCEDDDLDTADVRE